MKNMVIRCTAHKREVGLLMTTSQCKEDISPQCIEENRVKCSLTKSDGKKSYVSLKFKLFEKYRHLNAEQLVLSKQIQNKLKVGNYQSRVVLKSELEKLKQLQNVTLDKNVDGIKNDKDCDACPPTGKADGQPVDSPSNPVVCEQIIPEKQHTDPEKHDEKLKENDNSFITKTNVQFRSIPNKQISRPTLKDEYIFKRKKITPNLKYKKGLKRVDLKNSVIKNIVTKIKSGQLSDSSDDEFERKHPNRRLQTERPECDLPVKRARYICQKEKLKISKTSSKLESVVSKQKSTETVVQDVEQVTKPQNIVNKQDSSKTAVKETEEVKPVKREHVASSMWEDVLDSPQLWEEETVYEDVSEEEDDFEQVEEIAVDYEKMLNEFVLKKVEENMISKGETPYEKRFKEVLEDTNFIDLLSEFYIPPALMEVFYQNLTDDLTAEEALRKVCEAREWPEPIFTSHKTGGKEGYLFSCTLKTQTFLPSKPASNEQLSKELAALECLDWLGIKQRTSFGKSLVEETYFP